jgi:ribonuclease P protein component
VSTRAPGRQTFGPERRIRKRAEYLHVQNEGYRFSLPSFIVLMCARADDGPARLGITVTRKFGNAVARNRARRLLREAFRLSAGSVPPGIDLVFIPKRAASITGLSAVLEEWRGVASNLERQAARLRGRLAKGSDPTQTAASPKTKA